MKIQSDENEIRGVWRWSNGRLVADDVCRRIEILVSDHLEKVGGDRSGWDALYRDPTDGRYWELVYLQSELHGGGPPTLRQLGVDAVRTKYGVVS